MPFSQDVNTLGNDEQYKLMDREKNRIYSLDPTNSEMTSSNSALHVEVWNLPLPFLGQCASQGPYLHNNY